MPCLSQQDQRSTAPTWYQLVSFGNCQFWLIKNEPKPFSSHLGPFGSHLRPFQSWLRQFGSHSGPFGKHLRPFSSHLRNCGSHLRPFGTIWETFGTIWDSFRNIWESFWTIWAVLEIILGFLGTATKCWKISAKSSCKKMTLLKTDSWVFLLMPVNWNVNRKKFNRKKTGSNFSVSCKKMIL